MLQEAYKKAYDDPKFQEFLKNMAITPMGISGEEADKFLVNWQKLSTWLLYDAGGAKISPETLGIERVK